MTKMPNLFSISVIVIRKNIKSSIEFVYSVFEFEIWWLCREVFQIKMTRFFSDILHKKYKTNFFFNFIFDLRQHVPLSMSSRTRIYSVFLKSVKSFLWPIWIPILHVQIGSWWLSEQMTVRISWSSKPMFLKRVSRPKKRCSNFDLKRHCLVQFLTSIWICVSVNSQLQKNDDFHEEWKWHFFSFPESLSKTSKSVFLNADIFFQATSHFNTLATTRQ